ncbi:MAG: sugar ABC transporter permease [Anaerolineae bacterium]|jgi:raffinose/stachyose/melibiose transport system permease protein|nr:MAG: sugar ABC transporter permease [Anaerolineae bacterium]
MSATRFRVLPRNTQPHAASINWNQRFDKLFTIALFTIPGFSIFLTFLLIPITLTARYSLYEWKGFGDLTSENYAGLGNYQRLYEHDVFHQAVEHTFIIMGLSLLIQLPLALGLALLVGRGELPGRRFFRTLLFIPYVFSEVITALIWQYVYHPRNGLANYTFEKIIPGFESIPWLGEREYVLYAIFAVLTWKFFGFHMLLYMAGLQSIPKDLEEAARIDGAGEWNVLRFVTLPLMGSTIRLTVFLSILGSFQQFVIVNVMTNGGPFYASEVMGTYLYKFGIQRFNLGYGSAIAVVLFFTTLIFSILYQRFVMRAEQEIAR